MVRNQGGKEIIFAHQEYTLLWIIPGLELLRRKKGTLQAQQSENRILIDDKEIDGISMENHHLRLPQRHTSRAIMYIGVQRGDRASLLIETREQLNPTDFKRPTEVMANGPDGRMTSDSHSQTTGVNLLGGNRLPATTAPGRKYLNGKDHNGPAPTRRTLRGSEYENDRDWHLRNMHYGEGWACDSTQSHSKRAKPTYTDPEDDRMTDSSLPIGSTSKTYESRERWQTSGGSATEVRVGRVPLPRQDNGGQDCGMKGISQALLETLLMPATQRAISGAYMKMTAMP